MRYPAEENRHGNDFRRLPHRMMPTAGPRASRGLTRATVDAAIDELQWASRTEAEGDRQCSPFGGSLDDELHLHTPRADLGLIRPNSFCAED